LGLEKMWTVAIRDKPRIEAGSEGAQDVENSKDFKYLDPKGGRPLRIRGKGVPAASGARRGQSQLAVALRTLHGRLFSGARGEKGGVLIEEREKKITRGSQRLEI